MTTRYATAQQLIARNPALANSDVDELDAILEASSRWIDAYCGRRFWLDETVTTRDFSPADHYVLDLGEYEIGSSSGVIVKTDDGAGTFATTVAASDYQLEPVNAPYSAGGARPYDTVRAIGTSWPYVWSTNDRQSLVRITARYGWPEVPAAIREACMSLAIYAAENPTSVRAEAIDGYSVSYATQTMQQSTVEERLLRPFRRMWAA